MTKKKTKTIAEEIMERSGNVFHSRVVELLRDEGWSVLVSPYYSDNFTDKPREIDIIAEKKFNVGEQHNWIGTVNVRLYIECKYITNNIVFWFDKKDSERAIERIMQDARLDHPHQITDIQNHHYLTEPFVAKLFASDTKRDEDNEVMGRAINQNLNAVVYYRDREDLKLTTTPQGYVENVLNYISYPLIVVNSFKQFHQIHMVGESKPQPITRPFQLEVNYVYKSKESHNEYFLIDVVSIGALKTFISESIEKADVSAISRRLIWEEQANRMQNQRKPNISYDPYD